MPLQDIQHIGQETRIVVWDLQEELEKMLEVVQLTPPRLEKYEQLSQKRKREYLGLRLCLSELGVNSEVFYDEKGKPFLESNQHISITHSYDKVAVALSVHKIGVDIELDRPHKIQNIRGKFVRDDEEDWLKAQADENDHLHIIWGIKEGLYKLNGGNLWNFLHHYKVDPFCLNDESIRCWISDELSSRFYLAQYKRLDNYFLTWVLDKVN